MSWLLPHINVQREEAYGRHMVDVRLLNHSRHGLLYGSIAKLIERVLVPDFLQVEIWTVHVLFEERQRARMRDSCGGNLEIGVSGHDEAGG